MRPPSFLPRLLAAVRLQLNRSAANKKRDKTTVCRSGALTEITQNRKSLKKGQPQVVGVPRTFPPTNSGLAEGHTRRRPRDLSPCQIEMWEAIVAFPRFFTCGRSQRAPRYKRLRVLSIGPRPGVLLCSDSIERIYRTATSTDAGERSTKHPLGLNSKSFAMSSASNSGMRGPSCARKLPDIE